MQASKVAVGIKVPFPFWLDGPLNDIIPSGDDAEAVLDVEAIEAIVSAMVSIGALIGVSSKLSSRFSASSRVSLLLAIATLGLRFLARSTKTEESVELDPVSDF